MGCAAGKLKENTVSVPSSSAPVENWEDQIPERGPTDVLDGSYGYSSLSVEISYPCPGGGKPDYVDAPDVLLAISRQMLAGKMKVESSDALGLLAMGLHNVVGKRHEKVYKQQANLDSKHCDLAGEVSSCVFVLKSSTFVPAWSVLPQHVASE